MNILALQNLSKYACEPVMFVPGGTPDYGDDGCIVAYIVDNNNLSIATDPNQISGQSTISVYDSYESGGS